MLEVQTNSWVGPPASKDMIASFRLSTDGSVWCKAASMDTIMRYAGGDSLRAYAYHHLPDLNLCPDPSIDTGTDLGCDLRSLCS